MSLPDKLIDVARLRWDKILRPGDTVVCHQVCAEPLTLTRSFVQHSLQEELPLNVFVGTLFSGTFLQAPANMGFLSYGAIGQAAKLARTKTFDIIAERYSRMPELFRAGKLKADVVLLQAALGENGTLSAGFSYDYAMDAALSARAVIVEINPHTPWTYGTPWPENLRVDAWVQADCAPLELGLPRMGAVEQAIASHVSGLVPDGATIQVGIGALPDATLAALQGHRGLGLHSGVLGDAGVQLIEKGVMDNSRKGRDAGISVTNTVCGSQAAARFVNRNRAIHVRHSDETHHADILAGVHRLYAINSALEVDLSGQMNCEELQGKAVGGVGGLLDFSRAARNSAEGRSIMVLPATAKNGTVSRIRPSLGAHPVTLGRSDADIVVTEHGVAHLRDVSLKERAARLIKIAAPQFREQLEREYKQIRGGLE